MLRLPLHPLMETRAWRMEGSAVSTGSRPRACRGAPSLPWRDFPSSFVILVSSFLRASPRFRRNEFSQRRHEIPRQRPDAFLNPRREKPGGLVAHGDHLQPGVQIIDEMKGARFGRL